MTPSYPIISIYRERGLAIFETKTSLEQITINGILNFKSNDCYYYDRSGLWTSQIDTSNKKISLLSKLLAKSFYNPLITIKRSWTQVGSYNLQELIQKINSCINKDDDVITQFVDAKDLISKVSMCEDFDALTKTLTDLVFRPDLHLIEESFG